MNCSKICRKDKIIPIEVKSSGYKTHKSLDLFCEKFSSRIGEKFCFIQKIIRKTAKFFVFPLILRGYCDFVIY